MFHVTPEQMNKLGEAAMMVDEDTVYISHGDWFIITTGGDHHFTGEMLELLEDAPDDIYVDWRIMNAAEVFFATKKFIPERSGRSFDIYTSSYRFHRYNPEAIKDMVVKNQQCWDDDAYRLDELFEQGKARVLFLRPEPNEKRRFAPEPTAKTFTFDLDGRILGVDATLFTTFYEMGFQITCPSAGPPAFLGLHQKDVEPDVYGFLAPLKKIGMRTLADGRDLYLDAAEVSWRTPEEGLASLRKFTSYIAGNMTPATTQVVRNASNTLLEGVAILRWHGLTDEQIDILHDEGRQATFENRYRELAMALSDIVDLTEGSDFQWGNLRATALEDMERAFKEMDTEGLTMLPEDRERLDYLKRGRAGNRGFG